MKMESKIGEMESQYFGKNKEHDKKLDRMDAKFKHELEELKSKLENVKEILSHLESTKKHVDEVNHNLLLQLDKEVRISKMLQIIMEYFMLLVLHIPLDECPGLMYVSIGRK